MNTSSVTSLPVTKMKSIDRSDWRWYLTGIAGWCFFLTENVVLSENREWIIHNIFHGEESNYRVLFGSLSTLAMISTGYSYVVLRRQFQHRLQSFAITSDLTPNVSYIQYVLLGSAAWLSTTIGMGLLFHLLPPLQVPFTISTPTVPSSDDRSNNNTITSPEDKAFAIPTSVSSNESSMPLPFHWQLRCPFDFATERKNQQQLQRQHPSERLSQVTGIERITRHPGLWSFALIGMGNALMWYRFGTQIVFATSLPVFDITYPFALFWIGPMLMAELGGMHIDSRHRRGIGGTIDACYESETSNVPFLAIITGKQGNVGDVWSQYWRNEAKGLNNVVATVVATGWIIYQHRYQKKFLHR
jgi:hypothetical protein